MGCTWLLISSARQGLLHEGKPFRLYLDWQTHERQLPKQDRQTLSPWATAVHPAVLKLGHLGGKLPTLHLERNRPARGFLTCRSSVSYAGLLGKSLLPSWLLSPLYGCPVPCNVPPQTLAKSYLYTCVSSPISALLAPGCPWHS